VHCEQTLTKHRVPVASHTLNFGGSRGQHLTDITMIDNLSYRNWVRRDDDRQMSFSGRRES
jgi:hypothetical protein